ncbi:pilus assembly protein N-terminal domain-containing protein [Pusillimonas sp. SM2304]|uniref:type II and III secretion system protein family protein n=1 Tax=Pusillimonas sp. SM2304 TaxID=3073241 RepID=UPI0028766957|nr:pilus assembly protein N-terminal domain-containing protein [Pusillimonas sp. SM2304]MDS1141796.1 pilus assembly protein N-terminal domain-containing protein [Pusillimonas sp. SM2304]
MSRNAFLFALMMAWLALPPNAAAARETLLKLQVGEVKVLAVPDVARVAVGDGHVVNAVTTDEKEVIVFARHEGSTALQVWSADGQRRRYLIDVAPEGLRQTQQELRSVLERIPHARLSTVGDKLVVEGDDLSDSDRERVAELAKRYPQLLDFTGQVGWDRMVLLDVQVVEVPRVKLQEFGLRWGTVSEGGLHAGLAWEAGSKRLAGRPGDTVMPVDFPATAAAGYFGVNALLSARINAMAQAGSAVVLAQPQLLARSGATAEFLAGGEVPYSTVDANGNTNTVFKPYGVSLRITPQIERNGAVRSRIEVEVSSVDSAFSAPNGPSLKTRRAATEFNVRSGQTLVLAGFLSREASQHVDKVPGLGEIPVLGQLFRSSRFQRQDTELAIFVTPVLVTADHPDLARRVQRGAEIVDTAFSQAPLINTPVGSLPEALPANAHPAWDPWSGAGSQWQDGALSDPPSDRGRSRANQHQFTE